MSQVLVFGGSTTQGLWDLQGGWPQRLRVYLDEQFIHNKRASKIYVFNLGVSGQSSKDILDRFEFETKQRLLHPKTLFIFSFGGNDCKYLIDRKRTNIAPEEFRKNVKKLIRLAQKYSNLIVFLELTPVDESKTNPLSWEKNVCFKNELIKQYNAISKEICKKEGVPFIEFFNDWIKIDYKNLLFEGLHSNSNGHQKMFEKLVAFLNAKHIVSSL